jgi:hypothetical protein
MTNPTSLPSPDDLRRKIAFLSLAEARALIYFLMQSEEWSVAARLNLTAEQAKQNVAERVLDFLAGLEGKLPRS